MRENVSTLGWIIEYDNMYSSGNLILIYFMFKSFGGKLISVVTNKRNENDKQ